MWPLLFSHPTVTSFSIHLSLSLRLDITRSLHAPSYNLVLLPSPAGTSFLADTRIYLLPPCLLWPRQNGGTIETNLWAVLDYCGFLSLFYFILFHFISLLSMLVHNFVDGKDKKSWGDIHRYSTFNPLSSSGGTACRRLRGPNAADHVPCCGEDPKTRYWRRRNCHLIIQDEVTVHSDRCPLNVMGLTGSCEL